MRVIFDHQIFCLQNFGGISRYFIELFEGLKKNKIDAVLCLKYSNNEYLDRNKYISFSGIPQINLKSKLSSFINIYIGILNKYFLELINRRISLRALRSCEYGVFHPTYYNPYFISSLGNNKLVVTVHDMIHEKYPQYFPSYDPTRNWKRKLIKRADRIIAISKNTKKDLMDFFPEILPNKIDIVYHGLYLNANYSEKEINLCKKNLELPKKFILFIGNRSYYKNFERFLEAITPLFQKDDSLYLICAGGGGFNKKEVYEIKSLGLINKVKYLKFKDNITLVCLYKSALVFVFPSSYEGFGLPILEAFECGCPVVCSDIGCFREAAGDAAVFFDPNSIESITKSIGNVICNENIRRRLIKLGLTQKLKFSLDKTIMATAKVYEKVSR